MINTWALESQEIRSCFSYSACSDFIDFTHCKTATVTIRQWVPYENCVRLYKSGSNGLVAKFVVSSEEQVQLVERLVKKLNSGDLVQHNVRFNVRFNTSGIPMCVASAKNWKIIEALVNS